MVKKQLTHISEKEIEILEAFRKLNQKKQKFYYNQILDDAIEAEIKTDDNIVERCKISSLIYVDFITKLRNQKI
ncbi:MULTISPECIES: hypothetical protein [unclassified Sulfurimonas]|jgi:hypothetical protein|uniref:hypothetical protein n=1 Tax=unclassified Sulfurimonas TaxID=2623549 RepID=UPI0008B25781|nr:MULTISPECIES: hypothetical protein [unclassified Sulfurimonas]MBS4067532.1 hypothetical protein [Sulfurimonas sp.]MDD3854157.1 hypothetical protein [Sulfurimonas sp.]MDX9756218.1 hypothetical protein [Sulfurimonas sp.]OHE03963.1 MAG: hypothetical protein A2345_03785 [Sulfurimonas sp. RIFOXYB12_FULL_35_9]